jgi:hypothetical protein
MYVIRNRQKYKTFLNTNAEDELDHGQFFTEEELEEIKNNYNDYNFADVVLTFPNPDFKEDKTLMKSVSY